MRTEFPFGYPGEIKWSPDGTKLAVSTYDVERTRHESYVVDPATGVATHLLSGCVIVWSHDSRFLAVHGEPDPGISIVDVMTGEQGKVSRGQQRHSVGVEAVATQREAMEVTQMKRQSVSRAGSPSSRQAMLGLTLLGGGGARRPVASATKR